MVRLASVLAMLLFFSVPYGSLASENEPCLQCHSDPDLATKRGAASVSLYVDARVFSNSVHRGLSCVQCHADADPDDLPHPERLNPVYCGTCHDEVQLQFESGIHGQALHRKAIYAPTCKECHGKHDITPSTDPASRTFKMNIPFLCGKCHREGAPVARVYNISEHNIIENYSQSIHGEGLFKKGLAVTATCTDCHGSHLILPHSNAKSSISRRNISATCMKCHSRIEEVHLKVIRGELWEAEPGAIPACTDCHLPHKVRKESMAINVSDRACLKCHETDDVHKVVDGKRVSLTVGKDDLSGSVHRNIPCVKCHADIDPRLKRPCEPADRVDCSNCHAKIGEEYIISGHGQHFLEGHKEVPYCTTCHGDHGTLSHFDDTAPTFRSSIPALCGDCHREDGKAARVGDLSEIDAYFDYSTSVHGRGLTEKGLLPSAVCTDCHNSHMVAKHTDERSSVHRRNIPATCASCHRGIYKQYVKSVHFSTDERKMAELPTCTECHSSHLIAEVERDKFMTEVTDQCGSCHKELAETYLDTMHGKAYHLGYLKAAKCSDCHGAHSILGVNDPGSSVGFRHVVDTCKKCHEDANRRFTGYLTHATHHDRVKYPILHTTYWAMTLLLVGVFSFFGVHTLLWLPRSFKHLREREKQRKGHHERYFIKRFTTSQRVTHIFVIVSFMSLALTGMMLKFSSMPWAEFIADMLGGVVVAGAIHRIAAVTTFGYFIYHIFALAKEKRRRRLTWREFIFQKNSLLPNKQDFIDFAATLRWFLGRGPRPEYGRWTYWEKFDYFAVFWGVAVIGASGLMLWFPEFFTRFVPGVLINVATIVHSDEALLAVGFIFTIHFFNTHLRPEAFPMDKVIFTGIVPLDEYKADRPREYEELKDSGELRKRVVMKSLPPRWEKAIYAFGLTFLGTGILLIGLIIYSVLFGYK
ncbi:MAG: cytochrome c3 family protein [Candidatus Eiseniibacteriota bacterium]|nr:MAG: cytochrome c3 family protein [Candidatus Eisenbacteria bacterium]